MREFDDAELPRANRCLASLGQGKTDPEESASLTKPGRIGYTWDHDMHLYVERAKACEVNFGNSDYHRGRVAQMLNM